MSVLQVAGVFQVVLPDGWTTAQEAGRTCVISPPDGLDLAVVLSVYRHDEPQVAGRSAEELVRELATGYGGLHPDAVDVVVRRSPGQERAFTSFRREEGWCFAGFLAFPGGVVVATATADGPEEGAAGEALVVSIAPLGRRRWWRRG